MARPKRFELLTHRLEIGASRYHQETLHIIKPLFYLVFKLLTFLFVIVEYHLRSSFMVTYWSLFLTSVVRGEIYERYSKTY